MPGSQMAKDIFRAMSFMKGRIFLYLFSMISLSMMLAAVPIIQAIMIKKMIEAAEFSTMSYLVEGIIFLLFSLLVIFIFIPLFRYLYNACAKTTTGEIKIRVFEHRSRLPVRYFETTHSGKMMSRLTNDVTTMAGLFTGKLRSLIHPVIYGITAAVPMFILEWRISSALLLLNVLSFFINSRFVKPMRRISKKIQQLLGDLSARMVDLLAGAAIIKMYPVRNLIVSHYKDENAKVTDELIRREKTGAYLDGINYMLGILSSIVVLSLGVVMVSNGATTFGTLFALFFLQSRLSRAFLEIGIFIPEVQNALSGADRVFEFLDEPTEPVSLKLADKTSVIHNWPSPPYIHMEQVSFSYTEGQKTLENISLSVGKGQSAALVGPSGGGKSTLLKILLGFYPPDSGEIEIDGKSLGQYSIEELRNLIAYVPQECYLFNSTIEENIRYGKPDASPEEVVEAAKAAYAHDFIMQQPHGYKSLVGERGSWLSGGQRQRIAIARAILRNAPILLLDEATSALDYESEQLIQKALQHLMKDRTTISIAHRLATVEQSDQIYVIENGRVVEQGTHTSLLRAGTVYKRLYEHQFIQSAIAE